MSKIDHFGNNILYLLSEKKSIQWTKFRQYVEMLNHKEKSNSYFIYSLSRKLNALGYLDIEKDNKENKMLKTALPQLIELPFIKLTFLLTGARSPELLKIMKSASSIEVKKIKNKCFPDTVIVKPENIEALETWLKTTSFQGNKLSDYIQICKNPLAWNILESSENDIMSYEESLKKNWFSVDKSSIQEIFDINELKFKPFKENNLIQDRSLIKIFHKENYYKYYLFNKNNKDGVNVDLDWGKFLMIKQSNKSILKYNKDTFELESSLRLPLKLERGLTLLSGYSAEPNFDLNKEQKNYGRKKPPFVFKKVSYKIAGIVANKLGQKLNERYQKAS